MIKFNSLSQIAVTAAVVIGMSAALRPAMAQDAPAASWFAAKQQALSQKLDAKLPITFKFIGNSVVPVFLNTLPKMRFVAVERVSALGGATRIVMR
ncbi:MAG: hypothetical protein SFV19_03800 [Rhodospirillaceae bacterium]|nr:hypothetical protein [Rhodospirillaceae bacterium]